MGFGCYFFTPSTMATSRLALWAVLSRVTLRQLSWGIGLCGFCCFMVVAGPVAAQGERRLPARENQQERGQRQQAPVRESKSAPLPAKKLEEALRLLLQADSSRTQSQQAAGLESQGLVVDQTISKIGRDFYSIFYNTFEPPPGVGEYNITIGELPSRGNSALVSLSVNDEPLLEMPLQPKYDLIEEAAAQAVAMATEFLLNAQQVNNQLERGELKGLETY